jgi:hypothetical protein
MTVVARENENRVGIHFEFLVLEVPQKMDLLSVSFSIIVFKLTLRLLNNETNSLKFTRLEDPSPSSCPLHENSCLHKKLQYQLDLIVPRFSHTLLLNFSISIFRAVSITVAMFCLPKITNLQAEAICSLLLLCFSSAHPKFFKSEYPAFVQIVSLFVTNTNRIHGQQKSF